METDAIHKTAMISPLKGRMTLDLIRGKNINDGKAILENTNTKSSRLIKKVLDSAIANAVNNFSADESKLFISECYINPGPVYKRIKFHGRGHTGHKNKRTSHIIVKVSDGEKEV